MRTLLVITRVAVAVVAGWPLTFVPVLLTAPLGLHGWGYAHTGLPLVLYPVAVWLVYRMLGRLPPFKNKPDETSNT